LTTDTASGGWRPSPADHPSPDDSGLLDL